MALHELMPAADQLRLELSLQVRENIIRDLTKTNAIPSDPEMQNLLMKALDGMDRTILSKAKLKSDDSAAQNQANATRMVADVLKNISRSPAGQQRLHPQDVDMIELTDVVDGETHIGVQPVRYQEIMKPRE